MRRASPAILSALGGVTVGGLLCTPPTVGCGVVGYVIGIVGLALRFRERLRLGYDIRCLAATAEIKTHNL